MRELSGQANETKILTIGMMRMIEIEVLDCLLIEVSANLPITSNVY